RPGRDPLRPYTTLFRSHDEFLLQAEFDASGGAGDLAGDEGFAAAGRLVIEENAAAGVQSVGLAVVHRQPVRIHLGAAVGRARPRSEEHTSELQSRENLV